MKLKQNQAAFLYLLIFNCGKAGEEYDEIAQEAEDLLLLGGYHTTNDIIFDEDGSPMIEWPDEFSFGDWLNNPNYDEATMDSSIRPEIDECLNNALDKKIPLTQIITNLL